MENALEKVDNKAWKRTIWIDGRGSKNALGCEENRTGKRAIRIDSRGFENALEDEVKEEEKQGWKTHYFSLWLRAWKLTQMRKKMAKKRTILIDGWELENTLKREEMNG